MVVTDDLRYVGHGFVHFEDGRADLTMTTHLRHLGVGQAAWLEQDGIGDADLADVMKVAADPDRHLLMFIEPKHRGHPLRKHTELAAVLAGLEVPRLDRRRQREGYRV